MAVKFVSVACITWFLGLCHGVSVQIPEERSEGLGMINPDWTYISNYSFTVAVLIDIDLLGGGTLIEQNWVLTAASVTRGFNASDIRIRVGSNSAYVDGKVHSIIQVIEHPQYAKNSSYNLALLKIDTPIYPKVASKISYIGRIPFVDNGVNGNVTGYGSLMNPEANGDPGVQLAIGYVYTASYCQRNWGHQISSLHICGYCSYAAPCKGDEGGPLFRCWVGSSGTQCELLGIVAGINLCVKYEPFASVDVGQFAPWIIDTIKKNS